jgi:hypothetical protein
MLIAPLPIDFIPLPWSDAQGPAPLEDLLGPSVVSPEGQRRKSRIACVDDAEDEDDDLGDEEDLAVAQPNTDEESSFDDFDDEFDDDFEEEENDPDWDHPDDAAPESPPPGKGGGRKK